MNRHIFFLACIGAMAAPTLAMAGPEKKAATRPVYPSAKQIIDAAPAKAREALGSRALIGVSCYNDLDRARHAAAQDVDYLAFGAVFPSPTKPMAPHAPLPLFAEARSLGKPTVAIGGIRPDNSAQLRDAGADFIAVISGVFDAPDPVAALLAYHHSFSQVAL